MSLATRSSFTGRPAPRATAPSALRATARPAIALLAVAFTAACGPAATDVPPATDVPVVTEAPTPTEAPTVDTTAAYCDAYLEVLGIFLTSPLADDPDSMPTDPEEVKAAARTLADGIAKLRDNAPEDLAALIAKAAAPVEAAAENGDIKAYQRDSDVISEAEDPIDFYAFDHCGWNQVEVTASDKAFTGIPASLPAGKTAFKVTSASEAMHVMLITRRKPGVTASASAILDKGDNIFETDLDLVAAVGIEPGGAGGTAADLTPGGYIVLDPLPIGEGEDSPQNFQLGMFGEFTVK